MKTSLIFSATLALSIMLLTACNQRTHTEHAEAPATNGDPAKHAPGSDHSHAPDDKDHAKDHSHGPDAKAHAKEDDPDHDHDHDHERIEDGPNGGRLLTSVEPHIELFIMPDRKVQLTAVDDADKAIPIAGQTASAIGGSRSQPTKLAFTQQGTVLLSDAAIPDGLDIPLVLSITPKPGAKTITEKLQLNLRKCPECSNKEYACTCDHHHDD